MTEAALLRAVRRAPALMLLLGFALTAVVKPSQDKVPEHQTQQKYNSTDVCGVSHHFWGELCLLKPNRGC